MEQIKERPILFSGEMVRAILEGRKTQTRRILKDSIPPNTDTRVLNEIFESVHTTLKCPFGKVGDRLWVREIISPNGVKEKEVVNGNMYFRCRDVLPKIFLEIKNIRIERLQDISAKDVKAEGTPHDREGFPLGGTKLYSTYIFINHWVSLYGVTSWYRNPWVWVIEFEVVR